MIVGVKEVPTGQILPGKTYFCFSHTHKGQSHNMPMLEKFLNSACTLIDYELLTDEKGQRLVAFGKFAGYAGIINCLHGIGIQLIQRGYRTPFLVRSILKFSIMELECCLESFISLLESCRGKFKLYW